MPGANYLGHNPALGTAWFSRSTSNGMFSFIKLDSTKGSFQDTQNADQRDVVIDDLQRSSRFDVTAVESTVRLTHV